MEDNIQSKFKKICVFCGSKSGHKTVFGDAALELGHELVKRRIDLVYGGGSVGLMGLISQTVYDGGCHVLGVIPTALMPLEIYGTHLHVPNLDIINCKFLPTVHSKRTNHVDCYSHKTACSHACERAYSLKISGETVGELKIVSDMHERKAEMAQQADAFVALPGGYGTMEEVLEMITWSQLGIHNKPVGLLNVEGYYDSLLALFDNSVAEGFIKPTARNIVLCASTAKELLVKMEQYTPVHEQVAPSNSWEIRQLGYSTRTDPS